MAKYLNKEMFLQSMGLLGNETKYGNRDGKHQSRSYSTWMGYEIMDSVEDSIVEEDVVEVVRCKDCKHYVLSDFRKPNEHRWCEISGNGCDVEYPEPNDFCSYGERREGE